MTQPSFADRDGWIWMDAKLVPWREAQVHVLTHTLHSGLGVFEGVRAYNTPQRPCIFRLAEHTIRLFDSAHILDMKMPFITRDTVFARTAAKVLPIQSLDDRMQ